MDKVLNTHLQNFMSCSRNLLIGNLWLKLIWLTPYVNLERNIFSVGVSNALFYISRSHENILLIEQMVEIRYIALASYKSFNGSQSSATDFEKSFNYFYKLGLKFWLAKFEHSLASRNVLSHCLYLYLSASVCASLPASLYIYI